MWVVDYYKNIRGDKPVEVFIAELQKTTIAEAFKLIDVLERRGPALRMPYSKKLAANLFELRIRGREEVRIFYCYFNRSIFLLHAIKKKTDKIPAKDLDTATGRMKELTQI